MRYKSYLCNGCKRSFTWDSNSTWYGSYYDLEYNPKSIKYYCSKGCKNPK